MSQRGGRRPGAGRKVGGRDKSKIEADAKIAAAAATLAVDLTPEQIAAMQPLDVMLHAIKVEALAGQWRVAASLAKEAAPYVHAKRAPVSNDDASDDGTIVIKGGLPDADGD